ncbi:MAG: hypothetical protein E6K65_15260 [Nitrospirae bacterium]|nr:MAG: hypothetical protein E6K65_15260 [Nitrospirota bacterium]
MSEPVDQEIAAIKAVLSALAPLSEKAQVSVLEYVTKRLELPVGLGLQIPTLHPGPPLQELPPIQTTPAHIKDLKSQKKPRSANEMAAIVAYYLSNSAPADKRKATINQKDIETFFKIAEFPLPEQVRATLPNAKNAGYFDLAGDGEYKLNAVGHNLVAHSMPRGSGSAGKPASVEIDDRVRSVHDPGIDRPGNASPNSPSPRQFGQR